MKILVTFLVIVSFACANVQTTPNGKQNVAATSQAGKPDVGAHSTHTAKQDNSPRLVLPAKGGAPVMGIPVGGGLYLPVTGGAPIVGTSITK